jgi:hypothetical protein
MVLMGFSVAIYHKQSGSKPGQSDHEKIMGLTLAYCANYNDPSKTAP